MDQSKFSEDISEFKNKVSQCVNSSYMGPDKYVDDNQILKDNYEMFLKINTP